MSEPLRLEAGPLSIVLSRTADRYRHEVVLATDEPRVVIASLEGADNEVWPPSPPFQELHTHQGERGAAVLLIGRAGRSHWSASIEPDREHESVVFDIACRCTGSADWLGSSYSCLAGQEITIGESGRSLRWSLGFEVHVMEGQANVSDQGKTGLLTIAPTWTASTATQTVRWKYRLRRAGSSAAAFSAVPAER